MNTHNIARIVIAVAFGSIIAVSLFALIYGAIEGSVHLNTAFN